MFAPAYLQWVSRGVRAINIRTISVTRETPVRDALQILDDAKVGLLLLLRSDGTFERSVTGEDLRGITINGGHHNELLSQLPETRSIAITDSCSRRDAFEVMNQHGVNFLPVLNEYNRVVDVLDRQMIDEPILLSTPHMGDAERGYVEQAFRTNWIAPLGPNVDAFEREFADLVGIRSATAVSSGTAAIHLALRVLGVGPADRVFCSTLTFAASANPIAYQDAEPVFIDSDPQSWNMSSDALAEGFRWAERTRRLPKAVIVVNLYGQSADMKTLVAICDRYNVPVIEDAAESLGARYNGQASGTFGKLGVYSFNGNKIITTSGGGMLVSDDSRLIDKAKFLATQARDTALHYQHSEIGYNYRMSNILAGVGRGQLKVLEQRVLARRAVFQHYTHALADLEAIQWMPEPQWSYSTRWLSACTLDPTATSVTPNELISKLAAEMIEARPLWKPMHLQPVFRDRQYFPHAKQSVSDELFAHGLCLPSGSNLSPQNLDRVADAVRNVLKGSGKML
jgi:dTDP-4-amino-4,6-dideoxygalactose transaminase